jgi:glycosyltransferase involved in cell wall biosynthesis
MEIVKYYANKDDRFLIVENQQNMGPMWSRKGGYKRASCDFIVFCDSDDYLPKNALELLYNRIIMDGSDIVVGSFQGIRADGSMGVIQKMRLTYGNDSMALYKSLLYREVVPSLCGRIFSRKLFDAVDYETFEDCTLGEDGILFYQITSRIRKVTTIDNIVYFYQFNPSSSSNHNSLEEERIKKSLFSINYIYNYLNKYDILHDDIVFSKIELLSYLIKNNGWDKAIFYKYITWADKENILEINMLSRYYKGIKLLCIYLTLNSRIINYVYMWKLRLKKIIKSVIYPINIQRGNL